MVSNSSSEWRTVTMSDTKNELESARDSGKYLLIWDKKGTTGTYFRYMERLHATSACKIAVLMNKRTISDCLDELRKTVIGAMRSGQCQAIDLDKVELPFNTDWTSENFPAEKIFDFQYWRSNYAKHIKQEELVDMAMSPVKEFPFNPLFTIAIISQVETFEELETRVNMIPNHTQFEKIIIQ